jgi:hypothetical protein
MHYLRKRKEIRVDDWKHLKPMHPIQTDASNCGVYCAYFIEQLVLKNEINEKINTNELRIQMDNVLRLNSN